MTFGVIDLHPGGDTIVIAAGNGPSEAVAGNSIVHHGRSGMIVLQSSSGTDEQLDIQYPDQVDLSCGGQHVRITGISTHSQHASTVVELPADRRRVEVSIGGTLELSGDERPCHYNGVMPLEMHYH